MEIHHLSLSACPNVNSLALIEIQRCRNLRSFDLAFCVQIDDDCLPQLSRLRSLQELSLVGTSVTKEGVKRLRQVLPRCRIQY